MTFGPGWVLVVADDATDRMLLFRFLERSGYHATVADDAEAALELLQSEPFDLVLLALVNLEPAGYSLLQRMKDDRQLHHIPVVVMAGADQPGAVAQCLRLGAEDCLDRPCEPTFLRGRVAAGLEKRLREREADYLEMMRHVAEAVATVGTEPLDPSRLDRRAGRVDPFGDLARAFQQMASELDRVRRQTTDSERADQ